MAINHIVKVYIPIKKKVYIPIKNQLIVIVSTHTKIRLEKFRNQSVYTLPLVDGFKSRKFSYLHTSSALKN
jgi:hypothetical protein